MQNLSILLYSLILIFITTDSSYAGYFSKSCDFLPEKTQPSWVKPGYEVKGSFVGVGMASNSDNEEEQRNASKRSALAELAQSISVTVDSSVSQVIQETNTKGVNVDFSKDIKVTTKVRAVELLRGVKIKDRWLDRKKCDLWSYIVVSKASVEKVKMELSMEKMLERFNTLLKHGSDAGKIKDVKRRSTLLTDAQIILKEIDFSYLKGEMSRSAYNKKLNIAIKQLNKEIDRTKGRSLIASIKGEEGIPENIMGNLLDHVKSANAKSDRKMGSCTDLEECLRYASDQGFSLLTMIKASKRVETSAMGAFKGTLTVVMTVYDVETRKVLSGPDRFFSQTIGWTKEEMDWIGAAEKIIKSRNIIAGK